MSSPTDHLQHTLQVLQAQIQQARAKQRQTRHNIRAKEALLAETREVLRQEFADAYDPDASSVQRKRRRPPSPPLGLVPLLQPRSPPPNSADREQDRDEKDKDQEDESEEEDEEHIEIKACHGWARGYDQERVWLRVEIQSDADIDKVHVLLSTTDSPRVVLPTEVDRTTLCGLRPRVPATLHAAFTLPSDVLFTDIQAPLRVACHYFIDDQSYASQAVRVTWRDDSSWNTPPLTRTPLAIYFPSHAIMQLVADFDQAQRALQGRAMLWRADSDQQTQSNLVHVYGLTDRDVTICIRQFGKPFDEDAGPTVTAASIQPLLVAIQDELADPNMATRHNTVSLLAAMAEHKHEV